MFHVLCQWTVVPYVYTGICLVQLGHRKCGTENARAWLLCLPSCALFYAGLHFLFCRFSERNFFISGTRISRVNVKRNIAQYRTRFLANVNSRSRSLYAVARPSVVCLSSVMLVHPTQAVQLFGNISTAFGTLAIH